MIQLSLQAAALMLCLLCFTQYLLTPGKLGFELKVPASRMLLLFVAMLSFEWLMSYPNLVLNTLWLLILMLLSFFIAPICLRFANSLTDCRNKKIERYVLYLMLAGWIFLLPLSSAIIVESVFGFSVNEAYSFLIHSTMIVAILLYIVQSCLCLYHCIRVLKQRNKDNLHLFSQFQESGVQLLEILCFAVVFYALLNSSRLIYCAFFDNIALINNTIALTQVIALFVFCFLLMRFLNAQQQQSEQLRGLIVEQKIKAKYAKSQVTPYRSSRVLEKIVYSLQTEQIFTHAGLSLQMLADHIEESPHITSQVINESDLGTFHEMINERRVQLAKTMLVTQPSLNIIDLAFACGFNAKSTFNQVFKSIVGATPSQYRLGQTKPGVSTFAPNND